MIFTSTRVLVIMTWSLLSRLSSACLSSAYLRLPPVNLKPRSLPSASLFSPPPLSPLPKIQEFTPRFVVPDESLRWVPTYQGVYNSLLALDVSCGIGDSTLELSKNLSEEWKVLGSDEDPVRVRRANERHPSLAFMVAGPMDLPRRSFDMVQVHTGKMLHIEDKWAFVQAIAGLLKKGGTVRLMDYAPTHSYFREMMDLDEDALDRHYKGWRTYDPHVHKRLLEECLESVGGTTVMNNVFHSVFRKY